MTVAELIAELQKQLPNSDVELFDYEICEGLRIKAVEADADGVVVIYPEL